LFKFINRKIKTIKEANVTKYTDIKDTLKLIYLFVTNPIAIFPNKLEKLSKAPILLIS